jgi:hypothetical protein
MAAAALRASPRPRGSPPATAWVGIMKPESLRTVPLRVAYTGPLGRLPQCDSYQKNGNPEIEFIARRVVFRVLCASG